MPSPHPIGKIIGSRISEIRRRKGLTQQQLADAIGVHVITLGRWEIGDTQVGAHDVLRMANVLGVTPNVLLCVEDPASALRVRSEPLVFVNRDSVAKIDAATTANEIAALFNAGFAWHLVVRPNMELVSDDELQMLRQRLDAKIAALRGYNRTWVLQQLQREKGDAD